MASSSFSAIKKSGLQVLVDSGCSSNMVDPEMIPNAGQHLREYQALQPPKVVYGAGSRELLAHGTAKLTIGIENTAGIQTRGEHVCYFGTWSWSAALANGVEAIISAFPALRAKGEHFPLRADPNLYFLDAILPELPSEYANVGETSGVMLWHRRLGHINAQSVIKTHGRKRYRNGCEGHRFFSLKV